MIDALVVNLGPVRSAIDLCVGGADTRREHAHADCLERFAHRGVELRSTTLSERPLALADASIDVVLVRETPDRAERSARVLHEASRVLRVGGVLVVGGLARSDLLAYVDERYPGGYVLAAFTTPSVQPARGPLRWLFARLSPDAGADGCLVFVKRAEYCNEFSASASRWAGRELQSLAPAPARKPSPVAHV